MDRLLHPMLVAIDGLPCRGRRVLLICHLFAVWFIHRQAVVS